MKPNFSTDIFLNNLAQELIQNFVHAGAATTPSLVGGARETEVRQKLEMLLPQMVSVASGCVIDSYGATSSQTDIVIYERDNCPVFSINNAPEATYIPCEGVVAVGEIKSTLATSELQDSVAKIRNVKSLDRRINNATCYRQYGSSYIIQGGNSQTYDPVNKPWDQIYGFILGV